MRNAAFNFKVLAERHGVTLYSVGEADDDGDEPGRRERLQELRLAGPRRATQEDIHTRRPSCNAPWIRHSVRRAWPGRQLEALYQTCGELMAGRPVGTSNRHCGGVRQRHRTWTVARDFVREGFMRANRKRRLCLRRSTSASGHKA